MQHKRAVRNIEGRPGSTLRGHINQGRFRANGRLRRRSMRGASRRVAHGVRVYYIAGKEEGGWPRARAGLGKDRRSWRGQPGATRGVVWEDAGCMVSEVDSGKRGCLAVRALGLDGFCLSEISSCKRVGYTRGIVYVANQLPQARDTIVLYLAWPSGRTMMSLGAALERARPRR